MVRVRHIVHAAVFAGLAISAVGGIWYVFHDKSAESARLRNDIAAIEDELKSLRSSGEAQRRAMNRERSRFNAERARAGSDAEGASTDRTLGEEDAELDVDEAGEAEASDEQEMLPEEREARGEALAEAKTELMENSLEHDEYDPEWAPGAVAAIHESYSAQYFDGVDAKAECGSTICRVRFAYEGDRPNGTMMRMIMLNTPWDSRSFVKVDSESGQAVAYISREGLDLPRVDTASLQY